LTHGVVPVTATAMMSQRETTVPLTTTAIEEAKLQRWGEMPSAFSPFPF